MAYLSPRYNAVKMSTVDVLGIGKWQMDGVTVDQIDVTTFASVWKTFAAGMSDGGQVTFDGYYDSADVTGQSVLIAANRNGTQVTALRLYIDSTSYYTCCTTTPAAGSYVLITNYSLTADKNDVMRISFTAKISGAMTLTS